MLSQPAPFARDVRTFKRLLSSLYPAFQPIVRWPRGSVVAYEALLRVADPPGYGPLEVLDLAERLDGVHQVGRAVRAAVAERMAELPTAARMFVNLHAQELLDEQLYARSAPLSQHAGRVTLELTERVALDRVGDASRHVRRLRALGYRIAIDDLGAGYSSLSNLILLEPDMVKLDTQLIRGIDEHAARRKVVGSLAQLARQLGIELVAEGVETERERDTLSALGVELMQGFHFGRPGTIGGSSTPDLTC